MPDLRALRVAQTTSQLLQAKHLKRQPAWLPTVSRLPPSTEIARKLPPAELVISSSSSSKQRSSPTRRQGTSKVRRVFDLQPIKYAEDALRARFYREHPWELARPRLLLENDALDSTRDDWSRLQQTGRRTSGESVVQRQIYLMENAGLELDAAYTAALEEFYAVRMKEAVEARVAVEEGIAFGAGFSASQMEVGLNLEAQVLAKWREKAAYAKSLEASGNGSNSNSAAASSAAEAARISRRDKKKKIANAEDKVGAEVPGVGEEEDVLDDLLA